MSNPTSDKHSRIRFIVENGMVAGLYYGLTMLMILFPVISQFGPIQCRLSEIMVLLAFFKPSLTWGLTIGCLLANVTGAAIGQGFPIDILFGTMATLIACLLEAYASPRLFVAALWPVAINGLIVGTEIYFMFNEGKLPLAACMGWVALGELIAMAVGYAVFMILMRNKPAMRLLAPTRHAEVNY